MSSNIIFSTIDTAYPVAGQDNDSQGFRDNFTIIHDALGIAYSEITTLQQNALLKATIDQTNDTVANDLHQSSINNGTYTNFFGIGKTSSANSSIIINIASASVQVVALTSNSTVSFAGWPGDDSTSVYGVIRLHFSSTEIGTERTVTFQPSNTGVLLYDSNFQTPFKVNTNFAGKQQVVDVWSFDGGTTVFLKHVGEF